MDLDATGNVEIARFAIQESIRELQSQVATVERLRARAFSVVGIAVTVSAFMVGAALKSTVRGWRFFGPMMVGTALILLLAVLLWVVQRPIRDWRRQVSASVLVENYALGDEFGNLRHLAGFYDKAVRHNEAAMASLSRKVQALVLVAGVLLAVWVLMLWLVAA